MPSYIEVCEQSARAGGEILLEWWEQFDVQEKAPRDLVTQADLASQRCIRERVLGVFPDHGFLGEEEDTSVSGTSDLRWVVDPLDGTTNYVHRLPHFAVSVALVRGSEPLAATVFNPASGECYTAAAGEGAWLNGRPLRVSRTAQLGRALVAASFAAGVDRRSVEIGRFVELLVTAQSVQRGGSSALNLAYLAAGRYDAYWATSTKAWDIAAGVLLVREAGGLVTAFDGGPFDLDRPQFAAAATPELHAQLLAALRRAA